jgi:hypothetical protein
LRADSLAFTIVYMLYEASCNKRFIPTEELREVVGETEVSTLVKLLRDMRVIVSRKEYCDAIRHVRSALNLSGEDSSILVFDSLSDDGIIALNPAVIEEMRKKNGYGELSYNMVRRFISDLLGSMELAANMGSLNELVKEMATKYDAKFKIAVAKDIIVNNSCSLSEVERASLAAAKLASPLKFNNVVTILLTRAQRLAERISIELTQEDVEEYVLRSSSTGATSGNLVDETA